MDEFLLELQAKLDEAKSKGLINADIEKIQQQINKLKLQAEIDPKSISNLVNQLESVLNQKITISNIGINQQQVTKTGQQIGKIISDNAEKAISKVGSNSIGRYFKVDSSTSNQFKSEMEKLVSEWTNAKGKLTDINIQTRTSYDKDEGKNIERLHQAVVTYKNELDEVIKKTIAWRQIGTTKNANGEEQILRGFVEVAGQYSKSLDTVSTKTDTFVEKQKKAVSEITNQLNKIYQGAIDQNASKPIKDSGNLQQLENEYNNVIVAIERMGNASKSTFNDEQNSVKTLISNLEIMIKQYKNAETVATSLRSKDIDTVKAQYSSKLDVLMTKMESSGVLSSGFQKGADNLRKMLDNAVDASGLTQFLNGLDKLEAGYKRADAAVKAFNQSQKVGINVSGLESKVADLQRISPEIDKFETEINGAKVTIQSLLSDISRVNTQSDFSVVNTKFKAFTDAAKSAGISVTELSKELNALNNFKVNILPQVQDNMSNGYYADQVQQQIEKYNRLGLELPNVKARVDELITAEGKLNSIMSSGNSTVEQQRDAYEAFQAALKNSNSSVNLANSMYMSQDAVDGLIARLQTFLVNNSAMTRGAKAEIQGWIAKIQQAGVVYKSTGNDAVAAMKKIETSQRSINRLGLSWIDTLKSGMKTFSYWFSATSMVMRTIREVRQAVTTVTALDTALVDLRKTANMTSQQLEDFYYASNDVAKQMGVTTEEILNQAAAWSRLK